MHLLLHQYNVVKFIILENGNQEIKLIHRLITSFMGIAILRNIC